MPPPNRWLRILLCALTAALLYIPGLGRPALWEPDEGRYAEIAREMVLSGDFVTPRNDYIRYFEKPPLVYWAEAGAIKVFGVNEFAVRLPAALFTVGEVAAVCAIGEAMFGAAAGMLSALALATMPLVFGLARFATLDPALAFFMTLGMGAFYGASEARDFGNETGRRWMIAAAAMLAFGTLAKGPVALVLGGAIALVWLIAEGRWRDIRRIPFGACIGVYAAIVVPWFAIAAMRNPGMLNFFVIHEHLQRFTKSQEHGWGPWFFIPIVAAGAWPWLYFIPTAVAAIREEPDSEHPYLEPRLRFLVVWFAVIFIFFSIPRSKLGSYVLPAMPPIAIFVGFGLSRSKLLGADRVRDTIRTFAIVNAVAAAAGCIVLAVIAHRLPAGVALDGVLIAIALAAGAGAAYAIVLATGRAGLAAGAIAIAMAAVMIFAEHARGAASANVSYRELARGMAPYLAPGCELASYRHYVQSIPFYTGMRERMVEYRGELGEFGDSPDERATFIGAERKFAEIWGSGRCAILIANRKDFPALKRSLVPAPHVISCEGKKLALYNGRATDRPDCIAHAD